jgi:holo-[acyl-carrier protein] synthase
MILGLGADFCEIERVREAIERRREAFLQRLFTDQELSETARLHTDEATLFAVGFAAKEAAAKALGTGITRWVGWHDFTIKLEESARPMLLVSGGAQRVPSGMWLEFGVARSPVTRRYRFRLQGQSADRWVLWRGSASHPPCAC